ncbi:hypothetical protein CY35_07G039500 [Sphagnum magellanicum]|uniref:Uncharacterized protein n=1 Tax=Sphagnum magellanicum TaxID=128215 RepID=A0ACB8HK72_9BRYO|nr:hypothetical protein CY35_07G039500 [Sphagnum magellanicum]
MTTPGAVLGVIRAARPQLQNAMERVVFAVHGTFLAAGYSLVATGSNANSSSGSGEETEVGIDGWNEMDGAYAFRYAGNELGLSKSVTVKCLAMGDSLLIDAVSFDVDTPVNLELKPREFAVDGGATNYAEQYTNLPGLVDRVHSSILSKLAPPPVKPSPGTASSSRVGQGEDRHSPPLVNPLIDERQPYPSPGIAYPPVPAFGGGDLYPSPGAGIFGPRLERGYDGMLLGPNDPRWGRMGGLEPGVGVPDTGGIGVVPGARFDPYGPPGVPGFERNRFARDPSRPPGGHPDLEHYSPGF